MGVRLVLRQSQVELMVMQLSCIGVTAATTGRQHIRQNNNQCYLFDEFKFADSLSCFKSTRPMADHRCLMGKYV